MYCSIKLLRANSLRAVSGQLILIMALLAEAEHLLDIVAESGRGVSELALVRIDDGLVPDKVGLFEEWLVSGVRRVVTGVYIPREGGRSECA